MINVKSEIKTLKKVLVHSPKNELEFSSKEMASFLFDEYPKKEKANKEHLEFIKILNDNDIETVLLEDLVVETLNDNPYIKENFLKQFIKETNLSRKQRDEAFAYLNSYKDNKELILKMMSGYSNDDGIILEPLPNLYFTRDHFASIGNGISLNHMYSETRRRETIFHELIFNYHKDYKNTPKYYDRYFKYNIEGGDIMNLNEKTLLVGSSQRTQTKATEELAKQIFSSNTKIETVYSIDIPHTRAYMHLDTVLTQVDEDKFVIFPKIMNELDVKKFTKKKTEILSLTIKEIIENELNRPITLIKCGGDKMEDSIKEQWYDGSNTLAIAPGKVIAYSFNNITNSLLKENGVTVIELNAPELSKGRGGPRCMSMPLIRKD